MCGTLTCTRKVYDATDNAVSLENEVVEKEDDSMAAITHCTSTCVVKYSIYTNIYHCTTLIKKCQY